MKLSFTQLNYVRMICRLQFIRDPSTHFMQTILPKPKFIRPDYLILLVSCAATSLLGAFNTATSRIAVLGILAGQGITKQVMLQ